MFLAPHADTRPASSLNTMAAPGVTTIDVGFAMTSAAPCVIPAHPDASLQAAPVGSTTTLAFELPGSSGRANTAPPDMGSGGGSWRRQKDREGTLIAAELGPQGGSSGEQPGPLLVSAVMKCGLILLLSRFARPIAPTSEADKLAGGHVLAQ